MLLPNLVYELRSKLHVVKVKGHASGDELDAVGNRNADEMAKMGRETCRIFPISESAE